MSEEGGPFEPDDLQQHIGNTLTELDRVLSPRVPYYNGAPVGNDGASMPLSFASSPFPQTPIDFPEYDFLPVAELLRDKGILDTLPIHSTVRVDHTEFYEQLKIYRFLFTRQNYEKSIATIAYTTDYSNIMCLLIFIPSGHLDFSTGGDHTHIAVCSDYNLSTQTLEQAHLYGFDLVQNKNKTPQVSNPMLIGEYIRS